MDDYLILLPDDEAAWERLSDAERSAVYDQHRAFALRLEQEGHQLTAGAELAPSRTARTVRQVEGRAVVTEGPPTDAPEQLTGFYLIRTEDPDGLVQACALLAADSPVEIRRLVPPDAG